MKSQMRKAHMAHPPFTVSNTFLFMVYRVFIPIILKTQDKVSKVTHASKRALSSCLTFQHSSQLANQNNISLNTYHASLKIYTLYKLPTEKRMFISVYRVNIHASL